MIQPIAPAINL